MIAKQLHHNDTENSRLLSFTRGFSADTVGRVC
jgi:hypothetical protein